MSLELRRKYFADLTKDLKCNRINDLMIEIEIDQTLFDNLSLYAKIFLSKSVNKKEIILDEDLLVQKLIKDKHKIKNITPNGMIVPKRELGLDFNNLVKSYIEILSQLNVFEKIETFHFPPNLRLKYEKPEKQNLLRAHPTEAMHSDTWTGANKNWIASHVYILGDISGNHIRYAYPPENFNESWLDPLKEADSGKKYSKQFSIIDFTPKKGSIVLADATILHHSFTRDNGGIRVSLDTGFDISMPLNDNNNKIIINNIDVSKNRM